jgi:hypothetical protein
MPTLLLADWTRERALSGERVNCRSIAAESGGDFARVEETLHALWKDGLLARSWGSRRVCPLRIYQRADVAPRGKRWERV